jgi:hypothetical protein
MGESGAASGNDALHQIGEIVEIQMNNSFVSLRFTYIKCVETINQSWLESECECCCLYECDIIA